MILRPFDLSSCVRALITCYQDKVDSEAFGSFFASMWVCRLSAVRATCQSRRLEYYTLVLLRRCWGKVRPRWYCTHSVSFLTRKWHEFQQFISMIMIINENFIALSLFNSSFCAYIPLICTSFISLFAVGLCRYCVVKCCYRLLAGSIVTVSSLYLDKQILFLLPATRLQCLTTRQQHIPV